MTRLVPILVGVMVLTVGLASPAAAARQIPITFTAFGTATIEGCAEGGDPPCAATTVVSLSANVAGSPSPFSEIKGFKPGTAVVSGRLEIRMDSYDPDTGCYMTMLGRLVTSVGRNDREALALTVTGGFCPGGGDNSFNVDPSTTGISLFRGAGGSGVVGMQHTFTDLSTPGTSAVALTFLGSVTVRR